MPQGSVLGPLLFVVYINDLHPVVSSTIGLFADGTCMYRVIRLKKNIAALQKDVDAIVKWEQT